MLVKALQTLVKLKIVLNCVNSVFKPFLTRLYLTIISTFCLHSIIVFTKEVIEIYFVNLSFYCFSRKKNVNLWFLGFYKVHYKKKNKFLNFQEFKNHGNKMTKYFFSHISSLLILNKHLIRKKLLKLIKKNCFYRIYLP